uniref:Uncharacterized protein n=1 Tax=Arundo donax TaxID=35708 RepID=A0A0A9D2D5_ARUDO
MIEHAFRFEPTFSCLYEIRTIWLPWSLRIRVFNIWNLFPVWNPTHWNPLWMVKYAVLSIFTGPGPHIEGTVLCSRSLWIYRKAAFKPRAFDHSI